MIPVPRGVLLDLLRSVVNGDANSDCPGCAVCDRWHHAAWAAFQCLDGPDRQLIREFAQGANVDVNVWLEAFRRNA